MNQDFEGLSLVDLINLLEEAPEPAPISLLPQTGGWVILGLLIVTFGVLFARWLRRRHRARAYRYAALQEIALANADPAIIAEILRRTALVAYPRDQVVTLAGSEWLNFLDRSFYGSGFSDGPGRILATAPFRPHAADPAAEALAREWIKKHRTTDRAS